MPNSFPDCPLVPLLTASNWDIQLFRSCTVESVCTLHLCVATQDIIHHKFNPCATTYSIPYSASKCNQIFPDSCITDSVLFHISGFLVAVESTNGILTRHPVKAQDLIVSSPEISCY